MRKLFILTACFISIGTARAGEIFRDQAPQSTLNITTPTVIKAVPGMLVSFSITVAGTTTPGTINDAATTGAIAASNVIAPLPNAVQTTYFPFPFSKGLVVNPQGGQTITVSWQ
jgi:hypothetical protein